ncbi:uncharacterized protein [Rutidosis leptorrhynchoides]|uniref:uncharacterized protein n=1 Tax=Rutidosis leptorrhynchoides TaxID=125765 RepID=UPI003A99F556
MSARKLRPYFQAHLIRVLMEQPLRKILHDIKSSGRMINWAVDLGEFDISYLPRPSVKGDLEDIDRPVYTEILQKPSIDVPLIAPIMLSHDWMTPIRTYIMDGTLPDDSTEAQKLMRKAAKYTIIDGLLYKRSMSGPFLKCLAPDDTDYALRETYEGICGQYLGGRSMAYKILRQGFYWPTIHKDSLDLM